MLFNLSRHILAFLCKLEPKISCVLLIIQPLNRPRYLEVNHRPDAFEFLDEVLKVFWNGYANR